MFLFRLAPTARYCIMTTMVLLLEICIDYGSLCSLPVQTLQLRPSHATVKSRKLLQDPNSLANAKRAIYLSQNVQALFEAGVSCPNIVHLRRKKNKTDRNDARKDPKPPSSCFFAMQTPLYVYDSLLFLPVCC